MSYLPRIAEKTLSQCLARFPVVGITGPRQSGKSTLIQHQLSDYEYVTFDDPLHTDHFEHDPEGFLKQHPPPVVFDEVQYVPDVFRYIKRAVDQQREKTGRFVLTGSAQFSFLQHASESLAGRMGLFNLLPLQWAEIPSHLRRPSMYWGSYPELVRTEFNAQELWYRSYIDTYLNKDLRTFTQVGDLRDFRRFVHLLASRVTQPLDMTACARSIGISVPTVKRWLSVLEASCLIFLLPPFYNNLGKRITKAPKLYFYDTGSVCALLGMNTEKLYEQGPLSGQLFENLIVSDVLKNAMHRAESTELYYFRSSDQYEIDLIVDHKNTQTFIEIKKSHSWKRSMLHNLERFKFGGSPGILVYQGDSQSIAEDLAIRNFEEYLLSD